MPRPTKPYFAPWLGAHVTGLCRLPDGRWRIVATGERFRQTDERAAVEKFRRMTGQAGGGQVPQVIVGEVVGTAKGERTEFNQQAMGRTYAAAQAMNFQTTWGAGRTDEAGRTELIAGIAVPRDLLWKWIGRQLLNDPKAFAINAGVPQLATVDFGEKPTAPLKLDTIAETYDTHGTANWRTKGQVKAAMNRLKAATKVQAVADLDSAALIKFRNTVNADLAPAGAAQVFNKIKAAFGFGLKYGLATGQIQAAIGRLKVLYALPADSAAKPTPINRNDFAALLAAANQEWRAILLLSLNMALYLEDICTLQWEDFDLAAGTYSGRRGKTKVVRVGMLWCETIEAVKALPRKGQSPLLFTSATGLRFNASSKYDTFKTLRETADVDVAFSSIRDGAYTAAAAACDEKTAKLFAAHRFGGLMDSYVQRRPNLVKAAADAVYAAYLAPTAS